MSKHHETPLQRLENAMSKFLEEATALIATIAQGGANDQATKDAVAALQDRLTADEATETETQQVVTLLLEKLAVSTPPVPAPAPAPAPAPDSAPDSAA